MSSQENIIQIMPATGWVAVFDESGDESAEALVCFALVESAQGRNVRPMLANGKQISFADAAPNFLRVEELETFEDEGEDEEEEEDGEE